MNFILFSGFPFEWEDCVLSTVLAERKEYCEKDGTYEHATLSKDGIYGKTERYNRDFLVSDENKAYKITHRWDLCYNPANLKFGVICLNTYGDAIFSPIYVTFDISESFSKEFIGYALSRWDFINRALRFQQGTVSERMAVSPEDFLTIHCRFPKLKEQEKIADFLRLIDQRIAKQSEHVEHLKKYKRGVSKKLFDEIHKDSSCVIKQFSEVFEPLQNNTFSRECLTNDPSDVLNIHYGDILVKYGSVVDIDIDEVPYIKPETDISKYNSSSYLQNGDVVFADTAEDYTVGKMCEITNASGHRVLSGLHTMPYRSTINFVPMYLGYYFNSAAFRAQILPMIQGAKVSSISKSEMKKTTLHIPTIESQRKAVNILYTLDQRIKRTELVLQELQQIKKGLLQNLFI